MQLTLAFGGLFVFIMEGLKKDSCIMDDCVMLLPPPLLKIRMRKLIAKIYIYIISFELKDFYKTFLGGRV